MFEMFTRPVSQVTDTCRENQHLRGVAHAPHVQVARLPVVEALHERVEVPGGGVFSVADDQVYLDKTNLVSTVSTV